MEGAMNIREQSSFRQFSDQLRLQTSNLASLSLGDSIWSDSYPRNSAADRRNFDEDNSTGKKNIGAPTALATDLNDGVNGWKTGLLGGGQKLAFGNNGGNFFDLYNSVSSKNFNDDDSAALALAKNGKFFNNKFENLNGNFENFNGNGEVKNYFSKAINKNYYAGSSGKKNNYNSNEGKKKNSSSDKNSNTNNNNNNGGGSVLDKKYKTLPPSESLPRNEAIGGYIFVCNNDTMEENLRRQLFGLPSRYRDSVRAITPGLPLFLYNYSNHQLHGVFEAASFGGTNIDPTAWEDKKNPGESRFPAQVKVVIRKLHEPLEEDSFRPHLHHYDGPKFRLELNVVEALGILDEFSAKDM